MNALERARAAIRIGQSLQARLVKDVLDTSPFDPAERNELLAGAIGYVLRESVRSTPLPADKQAWLSAVVEVAVQP